MRSVVDEWLTRHNIDLLHPDVWPYHGINCGVAEAALTTIALGIAEERPVAIYGIAGFVLLGAAEVIKLYKPRNSVLIFNAGHNGCYPQNIGIGHQIDYDAPLSEILGISLDEPCPGKCSWDEMVTNVDRVLGRLIQEPGWHLVRLGFDLC